MTLPPAAQTNPRRLQQWNRVQSRIRADVGRDAFDSWFRLLRLEETADDRILLTAPTQFVRDWLITHYSEQLLKHWRREDSAITAVDIEATARTRPPVAPGAPGHMPAPSVAAAGSRPAMGAILDRRFTFNSFIVGKSNELAHAAARRSAEVTGITFNPLFLHGSVGLGKTHLMHAIAWEISQNHPERKFIYLSAEKFMYQFVEALRSKGTLDFKRRFREIDVLMVDDIQFIAGKNSTQEEFFHTFNALADNGSQIIVSADRSPSDIEGIEERIRSRLVGGLVAHIHPADYELRLGILQFKAEEARRRQPNMPIPPDLLEFLARRIVSNVRELEGALNRVLAYADFAGRPVSVETAEDVLTDLLNAAQRGVTIDDIQICVANHCRISRADMLSARRAQAVAKPRQIAMYLSKKLTTRSLPDIGRKFNRDHTTVLHAVRRIEELRSSDEGIGETIDHLSRLLKR